MHSPPPLQFSIPFLKSLLRFSVVRLEERILPEKQRDAPDACERHERIYDPRDYRSLAAAYPRDDIEFEQAYAAQLSAPIITKISDILSIIFLTPFAISIAGASAFIRS